MVLYVDIAEWVLNKCALSRQPVDSAPNDKHDEKTSRVENKHVNDQRTHTVDNEGRNKMKTAGFGIYDNYYWQQ